MTKSRGIGKGRHEYLDEKDAEHSTHEPATHHIIKCKVCHKESKESVRYTLRCTSCRTSNGFRKLEKEAACNENVQDIYELRQKWNFETNFQFQIKRGYGEDYNR